MIKMNYEINKLVDLVKKLIVEKRINPDDLDHDRASMSESIENSWYLFHYVSGGSNGLKFSCNFLLHFLYYIKFFLK